jgi:hypothetical protein
MAAEVAGERRTTPSSEIRTAASKHVNRLIYSQKAHQRPNTIQGDSPIMVRIIIASIFAALVAGCATTEPIKLATSFNAEEVAWAKKKGTGTLIGSAVIQTQGGTPRSCAAREVALTPVAAYSTERIQNIYGNTTKGFRGVLQGSMKLPDDPGYQASHIVSVCDAQGSFHFDDLASGEYFVVTTITWVTPGSIIPEGGVLMRRVKIEAGRTVRTVLSP